MNNNRKNIKKKLFIIIFIFIIFFLTGSSIAFMLNKPLRYTFKKNIFVPLKNFTLSIFKIKSAKSLTETTIKQTDAAVHTASTDNKSIIKPQTNGINNIYRHRNSLKITMPANFIYPYLYHGIYRKGNNLFSVIMSKLNYLPIECIPFSAADIGKNYIYIKYEHNRYCRWKWRWKNLPDSFIKDWKPDYFSAILEGAAMNFQHQNKLRITGRINENVWKTAFKDLRNHKTNKYGLTVVWADKTFPKTLHLWKNGKNILVSFVNTGVFDAPTYNGIFPVYERYFEATMSGKTPWHQPYDDKNIPFINYFDFGEAIHGFPRGMYGINKSLGCLELPLRNAWIIWKQINYGTMVDVIKNTHIKPAFKQKNYLHPKIKNFIPDKNFLKYYLLNKRNSIKVISLLNKNNKNKNKSRHLHKNTDFAYPAIDSYRKNSSDMPDMPLKLKFIYVDNSMTFQDVPVTSLVYFKFKTNRNNTGYNFFKKVILTSGINYGGKIDILSKASGKKNKLFFSDVRNLKGTYIRSVYSLSKLSKNFNKTDIKKCLTIKQRNSGILSNLAVNNRNNTLWVISYLYSYAKNTFNNYLCKIKINNNHTMSLQKKMLLKNYVSYLTFDKNGNLLLSGLKFKNGSAVNYIEEIKNKYLNKRLNNQYIKRLYAISGKFSSTMPIVSGYKNTLWALKHSFHNGYVYNNILRLRIKQRYLKHKYANKYENTVKPSVKNIASIRGYIGNLSENSSGDLFFINNVLKHGIFYKTLYEINPNSGSYNPVRLLRFNGKLNGVAGSIIVLN
ncbi:MAG: hypothetical protein EVJ46_09725 [Candidatus Acididesulfobacter guangdongensis]|uniref:L,D-TPase catalytic domain-containing protein n=1 Tax=Acididesulfobacter guangdongensis TaxID=2597225 RepID=A0A519BEV0_ACIG2|nr:MAG: hypothetical protein EVJ46_09725 [Candidatus Acididesulfobacter guangdongensis]